MFGSSLVPVYMTSVYMLLHLVPVSGNMPSSNSGNSMPMASQQGSGGGGGYSNASAPNTSQPGGSTAQQQQFRGGMPQQPGTIQQQGKAELG